MSKILDKIAVGVVSLVFIVPITIEIMKSNKVDRIISSGCFSLLTDDPFSEDSEYVINELNTNRGDRYISYSFKNDTTVFSMKTDMLFYYDECKD